MHSRLVFALIVAGLLPIGCKTAAPIHPRAVEHNTYCAQYLASGDLEKAETRCKLALEFNPDYPEPYCNLGLIELRRNHWDTAKDYFIKAIHLNQDFAEAHNDLGFVFIHEGSFGKAHDEFQRALKVNPDYVEARYNLALAFKSMKNYAEARKTYQALIESNPNVADPHHDLCVMDIDEEDYSSAISECQEALRLDPKYVSAYFNLGNAYMKAGKFCEAQESYTDCIRVDQDSAECRNNVTIATRKCALLDPNLKEAASSNNAKSPGASTNTSNGSGAGDDVTTVGDDPANGFYKKGMAQLGSGLVNEARRSFNKCVRKNAGYGLCYYQLFKLDQQVQDNHAAVDDCKKMLKHTGDEATNEREECKNFLSADGQ
jgi:tetratricopeptide (TPR) repeat protein